MARGPTRPPNKTIQNRMGGGAGHGPRTTDRGLGRAVDRAPVGGPAAAWLAAHRSELNQRFARARKRFPTLDPDAVLSTVAEVLPPLAEPAAGSDELLSAVYDLILLHHGRGTLSAQPGLDLLLRQVLQALRPLLLQRPARLPGALSNAVENLGARGADFARALPELAAHVHTADGLLQAGAVLAWRLGEARLRRRALDLAPSLPPGAVLTALGLSDWPVEAAPAVVAALRLTAWQHPRELLSAATIESLRGAPERAVALAEQVAALPVPPLSAWRVVARVGAFAGFGGEFQGVPEVLDAGDEHRFVVHSGAEVLAIEADLFGWVSRAGDAAGASARRVRPPLLSAVKALLGSEPELRADGLVLRGSEQAVIPELAGACTYALHAGTLVASFRDSYHLRVATPWRPPL